MAGAHTVLGLLQKRIRYALRVNRPCLSHWIPTSPGSYFPSLVLVRPLHVHLVWAAQRVMAWGQLVSKRTPNYPKTLMLLLVPHEAPLPRGHHHGPVPGINRGQVGLHAHGLHHYILCNARWPRGVQVAGETCVRAAVQRIPSAHHGHVVQAVEALGESLWICYRSNRVAGSPAVVTWSLVGVDDTGAVLCVGTVPTRATFLKEGGQRLPLVLTQNTSSSWSAWLLHVG